MKNLICPFLAMIIIFLLGCSKDDTLNEDVLFYWNQTGCADPWNTGQNNTNSETEMAVLAYLENENIVVNAIYFDNNSPLDTGCESCGCGTGLRIIVEVNETYISEMEELGFYQ